MGAPTPELPLTMPLRVADLARVAISGELVVFDPVHRRSHRLNPTAAIVLDRCDGATATGVVCEELGARFGVGPDRIAADVEAILGDFATLQLVSSDPEEAEVGADRQPGPPPARPDEPVHPRRFATGPWRALDVTVVVTTDEDDLAAVVEAGLGSLARRDAGTGSPTTYELVATDHGVAVRADGQTVGTARTPETALSLVQWHLNGLVATGSARRLQLHASAARRPDGGIAVFPGEPNAGKSTLVAGLVAAGWGYLTDEMVAIDIATGQAEGYRKPVNLDPGAWSLFPGVVPADVGDRGDEHLVDPCRLHPDALAGSAQGVIALLAFPSHRAGHATETTSLSPAAALVSLVTHCTNLADHGQAGLEALADIVGRAPAFDLTTGRLDEAVAAVERLGSAEAVPPAQT